MEAKMKLCDVIRLKRMAQGLSQTRLGKKLDVSGVAVSGWETGNRTPSASIVPDLAAALAMTPEELATLVISGRG